LYKIFAPTPDLTAFLTPLASIYMTKPFPPPPFAANRSPAAQQAAVESNPFDKPPEEFDPRMSDAAIVHILKTTLRPDQYDDPRIIKFILNWVVTRSNADAARAAGMNPNHGSYWRARPEIHKAIEDITATDVVKHGYDASEMIERAKEIAGIDPVIFENPDGSYKNRLSDIPAAARRAIKKFKVKNLYGLDANGMQIVIGQIIEVEVWDKLKGIELLGSEKNIFKKTTVVQHDVTSNMSSLLLESGRRADERKALMGRDVSGTGNKEESNSGAAGRDDDGVRESESGGEGREDRPGDDIEIVSGEESFSEGSEGPL
jgi:hypothetical protein